MPAMASACQPLQLVMPPPFNEHSAPAFEFGNPHNVHAACMHPPTAVNPVKSPYPQPQPPSNDCQLVSQPFLINLPYHPRPLQLIITCILVQTLHVQGLD